MAKHGIISLLYEKTRSVRLQPNQTKLSIGIRETLVEVEQGVSREQC